MNKVPSSDLKCSEYSIFAVRPVISSLSVHKPCYGSIVHRVRPPLLDFWSTFRCQAYSISVHIRTPASNLLIWPCRIYSQSHFDDSHRSISPVWWGHISSHLPFYFWTHGKSPMQDKGPTVSITGSTPIKDTLPVPCLCCCNLYLQGLGHPYAHN